MLQEKGEGGREKGRKGWHGEVRLPFLAEWGERRGKEEEGGRFVLLRLRLLFGGALNGLSMVRIGKTGKKKKEAAAAARGERRKEDDEEEYRTCEEKNRATLLFMPATYNVQYILPKFLFDFRGLEREKRGGGKNPPYSEHEVWRRLQTSSWPCLSHS